MIIKRSNKRKKKIFAFVPSGKFLVEIASSMKEVVARFRRNNQSFKDYDKYRNN